MYLTFEDYRMMGGTVDETTFNTLEFDAEVLINFYTFNRLKKETSVSDTVKKLTFRLLPIISMRKQAMSVGLSTSTNDAFTGAVASQSNDGYSTSFNVLSASDAINRSDGEVRAVINQYLYGEKDSLGHNLLYRGVYPDE